MNSKTSLESKKIRKIRKVARISALVLIILTLVFAIPSFFYSHNPNAEPNPNETALIIMMVLIIGGWVLPGSGN